MDSISVGGYKHNGPVKVISDTGKYFLFVDKFKFSGTSDILVSSGVARGIANAVGAHGNLKLSFNKDVFRRRR
jgi:hypothetical protein